MRPTSDLYDDHEDSVQTCATQFQNYGGRRSFSGPVRTVECHHDNVLFRQLLERDGGGGVIVVDGRGSTERALMGDMLAAKAASNGWAGVIINGAIRDAKDIANIDIGVFALGVNPAKSDKEGAGNVNAEVSFGGASFRFGDWVYCDEDGVLISPVMIE